MVAYELAIAGGNILTMTFTPGSVAGSRVPSLVE
jgi:hypothetical protein